MRYHTYTVRCLGQIAVKMTMRYLIATSFLLFANGEQYDNRKRELSSPGSDQRLSGMQEYLLYLTPDEAQALQTTGAIVRPLPHLQNAFLQKQYKQSVDRNVEPQDQTVSSNEERNLDKGLEEMYKFLIKKPANEALAVQSQSTEKPHEDSRAKSTYTLKPPQKENAHEKNEYEKNTQYLPISNQETKSHSTEHSAALLPRYETEVLKTDQPLSDYYYFKDTEDDLGIPVDSLKIDSSRTEIPKLEEVSEPIEHQSPVEPVAIQRHEETQRPAQRQRYEKIQIPVEIQGQVEIKKPIKILQREQNRRPLDNQKQFQANNLIKKPEIIQPIIQVPTYTIAIGRSNKQPFASDENTQFFISNTTVSDTANKNQDASQHLGKLNIVAETSQNNAKKHQGLLKEGLAFKSRRPVGKVRKPSHLKAPRPYPVSWVTSTFRPVPVLQPENSVVEQYVPIEEEKTIVIPGIRNSYSKLNTPYLVKKIVPSNINQGTPLTYVLDQPENYVILRPIWEN